MLAYTKLLSRIKKEVKQMGGCTLTTTGENTVEVLTKMVKQIDSAEDQGLYLDTPITVFQQIKNYKNEFVILGGNNDIANAVNNLFNDEKGEWKKPFKAICHVHA